VFCRYRRADCRRLPRHLGSVIVQMGKTLTLHQVLERVYGVKTYSKVNPVTATVATSPTRILAGNPNRLSAVIVNLGTTSVYVGPHNDVSSTKGIYIVNNGGYVSMSFETDFELVSEPWWAISITSTGALYVLENSSLGGAD
jgi:hypothetical protein